LIDGRYRMPLKVKSRAHLVEEPSTPIPSGDLPTVGGRVGMTYVEALAAQKDSACIRQGLPFPGLRLSARCR
jgi:hypothetical protein